MSKKTFELSRGRITARRILFLLLVVFTTFLALGMITSAFLQNGITPTELMLLILYTLLILWVSTSFWTATLGFWVLLRGGDRYSIGRMPPNAAPMPPWAVPVCERVG